LRPWERGARPSLESDGGASALARPDTEDLVDGQDEDLAVADASGLCRLLDRLDHLCDLLVADDDLQLHFWQEVDDVLRAPVELGVPLQTPEALYLGDGEALHADRGQAFLHLVELEGLDDPLDLFHARASSSNGEGATLTPRYKSL